MDRFQYIREHVTAQDAAERYGVGVRRGRTHCLWHSPDKRPSLSFKDGYCKCFSCGAGGSSIDLVMQLFGLDAKGAALKLNADFGLGLDLNARVPTAASRRAREDKRLSQALEAWLDRAYDILARYRRTLYQWQEEYAPETREEPFHTRFVQAFQDTDYIEFLLDEFEAARTPSDRIDLFKGYRREVENVERKLHGDGAPDEVGV